MRISLGDLATDKEAALAAQGIKADCVAYELQPGNWTTQCDIAGGSEIIHDADLLLRGGVDVAAEEAYAAAYAALNPKPPTAQDGIYYNPISNILPTFGSAGQLTGGTIQSGNSAINGVQIPVSAGPAAYELLQTKVDSPLISVVNARGEIETYYAPGVRPDLTTNYQVTGAEAAQLTAWQQQQQKEAAEWVAAQTRAAAQQSATGGTTGATKNAITGPSGTGTLKTAVSNAITGAADKLDDSVSIGGFNIPMWALALAAGGGIWFMASRKGR